MVNKKNSSLLCGLTMVFALGCTDVPTPAPEPKPAQPNSFQMITGDDGDTEKERWNRTFKTQNSVYGEEPIAFLKNNFSILPSRGKALVLAMEEGRNAIFLARNGLDVTGIDYADEAIKKAKRLAKKHNVTLKTINADLNTYSLPAQTYDLIVAVEFYRPRLIQEIKKGLKKGGIVLWESHTTEQVKNVSGRALRIDSLLKPNELRELFSDFDILIYSESNDNKRAVASLIARKRN